MKVAIIENYKCTSTASRTGGKWDYDYINSYYYKYSFYSDQKEIAEQDYEIIHNFIMSLNKTYTVDSYGRNEEHLLYDLERSAILAEKLNCQIFEPGITHKSIFEHTIYLRYINETLNASDRLNADYFPKSKSYSAEIIEHETIPVIKYGRLIKDQDYWKGTDKWYGVRLDKDGNLCHGWGDSEIKLSTLVVDRLIDNYDHIIAVKGNEWGVIDRDGNFVINYQPYPIKLIDYDFCVVQLNGKSSCINYNGELLMPFTPQEISIINNRFAEATYDDIKLIYDLQKPKLVHVGKYNFIEHITDSLIIVRLETGIIEIYNHNSLKLNDEIITNATFIGNMIVAQTEEGWTIYDSCLNILFRDNQRKYNSVEITDDGYIRLTQMNQNNYPIYGLADMDGNILLACYSDSPIKVFQDNGKTYYILRKYKKSYICDSNGATISPKYDFISKGREGTCIAFEGKFTRDEDGEISGENGTFCAITIDGQVKFRIKCQYLYSFRNGYATIKQDYHYGKVNTKGEIVIPPEYEAVGAVKCGLVAACKYGRWGYLDEKNNIVIDFEYKEAEDFDDEGKAQVKIKGSCATINTKGELLTEWEHDPDYVDYGYSYDSVDEATYIKDGLAEAFNGDPSNYWNID